MFKIKKKSYKFRNIRLVVLVTYGCCLRCEYCFVDKENPMNMPPKMLLKAVDFLLSSTDCKDLQFHFFGGEPLMIPFNHIKETVFYGKKRAQEKNKNIKFILTTNGVMLTKDKVDFFKEHNVLIEVSLDGDKESQNKNRPQVGRVDSYTLIAKKLKLLFDARVENSCSMVISPQTVRNLNNNFNHLIELGFKNIFMMMACGADWKEKDLSVLDKNLKKIAKTYPDSLKEKKIILLNLRDWLSPFRMNTELSVNLDGNIFSACVTYLIHDEKLRKKYILDHINNVATKNIDDMDKRRLTNIDAMKVIYKENRIEKLLPNNIRAGRIITKFSEDLTRRIKKNSKLQELYEDAI